MHRPTPFRGNHLKAFAAVSHLLAALSFPSRALAALAALSAALAGCGSVIEPPLPRETGSVHIVAPLAAMQSTALTGAKVRLTQGNLVREILLDVSGELVAGPIENLPVGEWKVTLDLYDEEGDITHSASGVVRVRPGETTTLRLEAAPKEGIVEVAADITGFSEAAVVQRARIIFHNNQTSTLDRSGEDPMLFVGTKELKPGDYDYRIELYGPTFYASDRLYQSPWESVRVFPGKTVRVTWQASSGAAYIEMGVSRMPSPPAELRLEYDSSGARLAWSASPDPDVVLYRVYVKDDEFDSFSLRGETAELAWQIPESLLNSGGWAAVTALKADQRESFRSEVVYIPPGSGP